MVNCWVWETPALLNTPNCFPKLFYCANLHFRHSHMRVPLFYIPCQHMILDFFSHFCHFDGCKQNLLNFRLHFLITKEVDTLFKKCTGHMFLWRCASSSLASFVHLSAQESFELLLCANYRHSLEDTKGKVIRTLPSQNSCLTLTFVPSGIILTIKTKKQQQFFGHQRYDYHFARQKKYILGTLN